MTIERPVLAFVPLLLAATVASAQTASTSQIAAETRTPARRADPPAGFRAEFLNLFNESAAKFESLAEAMPADKFTWSPGAGVMSIARVYGHVARYNYAYPSQAMNVATPAGIRLDTLEDMTDKAQLIALLRASNAHVRRLAETMPDSQLAAPTRLYGRDIQQWSVLFQLLAHMNEHLGQSIAYARMNAIVPPWSR